MSSQRYIMLEKKNHIQTVYFLFVDVDFTIYNGTFLSPYTDTAAAKIIMPIVQNPDTPVLSEANE